MASFVLTAQLRLQAPTNLSAVTSQIQSQLQNIVATVDVRLSPQARNNLKDATQNLRKNAKAAKEAESALENFGGLAALAAKRFIAFTIAGGAVVRLGGALISATKDAIAFERQMNRVQQVTGVSALAIGRLSDEISRLGTEFGVSSTELSQASLILAQAGLSAEDTRTSLEALAKTDLAPTFDSINNTTEGAIAIFRQFQIGASELEESLGSINAVAAKFAVESSDIIGAVRRTGGAFRAAGGDLNELIALFTSVRATTRESAESIATGFRTIFTRLQRVRTQKFLAQLGVDLQTDEDQFVGPYEAIRRLSTALKDLRGTDPRFAQVIEELGGFRQISKVIPLIKQFDTSQRALNVALSGTDSLTENAATAQETLAVQIAKTREEFMAMIRSMAQTTAFQSTIKIALNFAQALIKVAEALRPILPLLTLFGAAAFGRSLGPIATGFQKKLQSTSGGFNEGGKVLAFNTGGEVPSLLTPGEIVFDPPTAKKIGYNTLSTVNKFAYGGIVPGFGNRDTVPAMLSPGSFVLRAPAVRALGFNEGGSVPKIQRLQEAGKVQKAATSTSETDRSEYGMIFLRTEGKRPAEAITDREQFTVKTKSDPNHRATLIKSGFSKSFGEQFEQTISDALVPLSNNLGDQLAGELGTKRTSKIANKAQLSNSEAIIGGMFESAIESLGVIGSTEQSAFDFPRGLKSRVKNWAVGNSLANIPVDAKRTLNSKNVAKMKSKIKTFVDEPERQGFTNTRLVNRIKEGDVDQKNKNILLTESESKRNAFKQAKALNERYGAGVFEAYSPGQNQPAILRRTPLKFNKGGQVPALLTPGEIVVPEPVARSVGYNTLRDMNQYDRRSRGGKIQKFNKGGKVQQFKLGGTVEGQATPVGEGVGVITLYANDQITPGFKEDGVLRINSQTHKNLPVNYRVLSFSNSFAKQFETSATKTILSLNNRLGKKVGNELGAASTNPLTTHADIPNYDSIIGGLFEGALITLGQPFSSDQGAFDFPKGMRGRTKNWTGGAALSDIPVDAKRTWNSDNKRSIKKKVKAVVDNPAALAKAKTKNPWKKGQPYNPKRHNAALGLSGKNTKTIASTLRAIQRIPGDKYKTARIVADPRTKKQTIRYAEGGQVPALLTPGELVVPESEARSIGYDALSEMNRGGVVQKFAKGGMVRGGKKTFRDIIPEKDSFDYPISNGTIQALLHDSKLKEELNKRLNPDRLKYIGAGTYGVAFRDINTNNVIRLEDAEVKRAKVPEMLQAIKTETLNIGTGKRPQKFTIEELPFVQSYEENDKLFAGTSLAAKVNDPKRRLQSLDKIKQNLSDAGYVGTDLRPSNYGPASTDVGSVLTDPGTIMQDVNVAKRLPKIQEQFPSKINKLSALPEDKLRRYKRTATKSVQSRSQTSRKVKAEQLELVLIAALRKKLAENITETKETSVKKTVKFARGGVVKMAKGGKTSSSLRNASPRTKEIHDRHPMQLVNLSEVPEFAQRFQLGHSAQVAPRVVSTILGSPNKDQILNFPPRQSKYVGSGVEAMVFSDGQQAYRIVRRGVRGAPSKRPQSSAVLQPSRTQDFGNVYGEVLPLAVPTDRVYNKKYDMYSDRGRMKSYKRHDRVQRAVLKRMGSEGFDVGEGNVSPAELHEGNFGVTGGKGTGQPRRVKLIDPNIFKKYFYGGKIQNYSIGGDTSQYKIGGNVRQYAKGGIVKKYAMGGTVKKYNSDDDMEEYYQEGDISRYAFGGRIPPKYAAGFFPRNAGDIRRARRRRLDEEGELTPQAKQYARARTPRSALLGQEKQVQRVVGYIDGDVLADPANAHIVKPAIKRYRVKGSVKGYHDFLIKIARQKRKVGQLRKFKAVYGAPGSGKTSLVSRKAAGDNARLRKTTRIPILTPDDIYKATEVIDTVASSAKVIQNTGKGGLYENVDRLAILSSSTKAERQELMARRTLRQQQVAAGDSTAAQGRSVQAAGTINAPSDTGAAEAVARADLGNRAAILGIQPGFKVRRKGPNEVPTLEDKKIGVFYGAMAPATRGHAENAKLAIDAGIDPKDLIVAVSQIGGTAKKGDPHSQRTVIYNQSFRKALAQASFPKATVVKSSAQDFAGTAQTVFERQTPEGSQRKFVRAAPGSVAFVGDDKAEPELAKYRQSGYDIKVGARNEVSGTAARQAIAEGNRAEMEKMLTPGALKLVEANRERIQARTEVLPKLFERTEQRIGNKAEVVNQELSQYPAQLTAKMKQEDPKTAAKVMELRQKRDAVKRLKTKLPVRMLKELTRLFPEKYGFIDKYNKGGRVRKSSITDKSILDKSTINEKAIRNLSKSSIIRDKSVSVSDGTSIDRNITKDINIQRNKQATIGSKDTRNVNNERFHITSTDQSDQINRFKEAVLNSNVAQVAKTKRTKQVLVDNSFVRDVNIDRNDRSIASSDDVKEARTRYVQDISTDRNIVKSAHTKQASATAVDKNFTKDIGKKQFSNIVVDNISAKRISGSKDVSSDTKQAVSITSSDQHLLNRDTSRLANISNYKKTAADSDSEQVVNVRRSKSAALDNNLAQIANMRRYKKTVLDSDTDQSANVRRVRQLSLDNNITQQSNNVRTKQDATNSSTDQIISIGSSKKQSIDNNNEQYSNINRIKNAVLNSADGQTVYVSRTKSMLADNNVAQFTNVGSSQYTTLDSNIDQATNVSHDKRAALDNYTSRSVNVGSDKKISIDKNVAQFEHINRQRKSELDNNTMQSVNVVRSQKSALDSSINKTDYVNNSMEQVANTQRSKRAVLDSDTGQSISMRNVRQISLDNNIAQKSHNIYTKQSSLDSNDDQHSNINRIKHTVLNNTVGQTAYNDRAKSVISDNNTSQAVSVGQDKRIAIDTNAARTENINRSRKTKLDNQHTQFSNIGRTKNILVDNNIDQVTSDSRNRETALDSNLASTANVSRITQIESNNEDQQLFNINRVKQAMLNSNIDQTTNTDRKKQSVLDYNIEQITNTDLNRQINQSGNVGRAAKIVSDHDSEQINNTRRIKQAVLTSDTSQLSDINSNRQDIVKNNIGKAISINRVLDNSITQLSSVGRDRSISQVSNVERSRQAALDSSAEYVSNIIRNQKAVVDNNVEQDTNIGRSKKAILSSSLEQLTNVDNVKRAALSSDVAQTYNLNQSRSTVLDSNIKRLTDINRNSQTVLDDNTLQTDTQNTVLDKDINNAVNIRRSIQKALSSSAARTKSAASDRRVSQVDNIVRFKKTGLDDSAVQTADINRVIDLSSDKKSNIDNQIAKDVSTSSVGRFAINQSKSSVGRVISDSNMVREIGRTVLDSSTNGYISNQADTASNTHSSVVDAAPVVFKTGGRVKDRLTVGEEVVSKEVTKVVNPMAAKQPVKPDVSGRKIHFASGGQVNAMLTPGEMIVPPPVVKAVGAGRLSSFNRGGKLRKMQGGGPFGGGGGLGGIATAGFALGGITAFIESLEGIPQEIKKMINAITSLGTQFFILSAAVSAISSKMQKFSFENFGKKALDRRQSSQFVERRSLLNQRKAAERDYLSAEGRVTRIQKVQGPLEKRKAVQQQKLLGRARSIADSKAQRIDELTPRINENRRVLGRTAQLRGIGSAIGTVGKFVGPAGLFGGIATSAVGGYLEKEGRRKIEQDLGGGGEDQFRTGKALSTAGSYATTGATVGAIFGPWGIAIGAATGGLIGFFKGLKDAEKEIKNIKIMKTFEESITGVTRSLTMLQKGQVTLAQTRIKVNRLTKDSVKSLRDSDLSEEGRKDILAGLKGQLDGLNQYLNKTAQESRTFSGFLNRAGEDTLRLVAQLSNVSTYELQQEFKKVQETAEKARKGQIELTKVQDDYAQRIRNSIGITRAFNTISLTMSKFDDELNTLMSIIGGDFSVGQLPDFSGLFSDPEKLFNPKEFARILSRDISNNPALNTRFSSGIGDSLTKDITASEKAIRDLPNVLLYFRDNVAAFDEDQIVGQLVDSFGDSSEFVKTAIRRVAQSLIGSEYKDAALLEKLREDFTGSLQKFNDALKPSLELGAVISSEMTKEVNSRLKFVDEYNKLAKKELDSRNAIVDALSKVEEIRADVNNRPVNLNRLQNFDTQKQANILGPDFRLINRPLQIQLELIKTTNALLRDKARLERAEISDRGMLVTRLQAEAQRIDRLNSALKFLSDVGSRTAITLKKIERAQARSTFQTQGLDSILFAESLKEVRNILEVRASAKRLAQTGNINVVQPKLRGDVQQFLEQTKGLGRLAALDGKTSEEVTRETRRKFALGLGASREAADFYARDTTPELEAQKAELEKQNKISIDANKAINRGFDITLGQLSDNFANSIANFGSRLELAIIGQRREQLADETKRAKREKDRVTTSRDAFERIRVKGAGGDRTDAASRAGIATRLVKSAGLIEEYAKEREAEVKTQKFRTAFAGLTDDYTGASKYEIGEKIIEGERLGLTSVGERGLNLAKLFPEFINPDTNKIFDPSNPSFRGRLSVFDRAGKFTEERKTSLIDAQVKRLRGFGADDKIISDFKDQLAKAETAPKAETGSIRGYFKIIDEAIKQTAKNAGAAQKDQKLFGFDKNAVYNLQADYDAQGQGSLQRLDLVTRSMARRMSPQALYAEEVRNRRIGVEGREQILNRQVGALRTDDDVAKYQVDVFKETVEKLSRRPDAQIDTLGGFVKIIAQARQQAGIGRPQSETAIQLGEAGLLSFANNITATERGLKAFKEDVATYNLDPRPWNKLNEAVVDLESTFTEKTRQLNKLNIAFNENTNRIDVVTGAKAKELQAERGTKVDELRRHDAVAREAYRRGDRRTFELAHQNVKNAQQQIAILDRRLALVEQERARFDLRDPSATRRPPRRRFATGGFISGTGSGDKIPALLEPGEFVLNRNAVAAVGAGNVARVNNKYKRFQSGGPVKMQTGGVIAGIDFSVMEKVVKNFGTYVDKFGTFADSIKGLEISLRATHTVEVLLNGASVLAGMEESIKNLVVTQTNAAINHMLDVKFGLPPMDK